LRRRTGWGSRLVTYAENDGRNHGIKYFYLLTETAEDLFTPLGYP
jgi:N-acetylglutamate synthase-like GNAT family acetyltransferase